MFDSLLIGAVYLIDEHQDRYFCLVDLAEEVSILEFLLPYLDHVDQDISILEGILDKVHHRVLQLVCWLDDPRSIGEDHLEVVPADNPKDTVPRGLRLGGDDRESLAYKSIEQGRFPHIGVPYNIDKSCFMFHFLLGVRRVRIGNNIIDHRFLLTILTTAMMRAPIATKLRRVAHQ